MARPRPSYPHARERGFTTVELIVALVVITILLSVAVMLYSSQKGKARKRATQAAAASYAQAVEAFRLENANYVPRYGTAEWPSGANGARGPVSTLQAKPLVTGGAPEIVTTGQTTPSAGAVIATSAPGTGYKGGTIVYTTGGGGRPFQYSLAAYWNGVLICGYGNLPSGPHITKSCGIA